MAVAYFSATCPHNYKNSYQSSTSLSPPPPRSPGSLSSSASYTQPLCGLTTFLSDSIPSWEQSIVQRFFPLPELIPLTCFCCTKEIAAVTRKRITRHEEIDPALGLCAFSLCSNCFTSSCSFFGNLISHCRFMRVTAHG
jgi:hypothetical protein